MRFEKNGFKGEHHSIPTVGVSLRNLTFFYIKMTQEILFQSEKDREIADNFN